ncbi:MAG: asparagine synthase (glutamine-hydrolyzing) [Candidatus Omnitrophota bacterium]
MCGICGIYNFNQQKVDVNLIKTMLSKLNNRGPDEQGIYIKNNIGLGHSRLAIIDLVTGSEPIFNEQKNICVILNGEIYNFQEIRKSLEKKGHCFKSQSDTEVIVHLYEEKGIDCLAQLRGMFAFAIWDEPRKRLFLARDRIGQKPLVWTKQGNRFVFASEFTALLADTAIERVVDLNALDLYLSYFYVPSPKTMFKNIHKLEPAHYLIVENNTIEIKKYWQLKSNLALTQSLHDYKQGLIEKLEEAVKLRLFSDVDVGIFLSGGMDSSVIAALASKQSTAFKIKPIKSFSVGFTDKRYNELNFARIVADKFNLDHHELIVTPKAIQIIPDLIRHYGEPFADYSSIPTYYLAKFAAEFVKVVLTGDGGDELFAGYPRYNAVKTGMIFDFLPKFLVKLLCNIAQQIPPGDDIRKANWQIRRFFKELTKTNIERYFNWISAFDQKEKQGLYNPDFRKNLDLSQSQKYLENIYALQIKNNFIDATMKVDIASYLPNDLLVKMDIATMANSLEARSPFLDHKFMEFAVNIPSEFKLHNFQNKFLLKYSFKDILPEKIINRKKQGFGIPLGAWLRGELKGFMQNVLLDKKTLARGYFNPAFITNIVDTHLQKKNDYGYKIWTLLMLELWHHEFID